MNPLKSLQERVVLLSGLPKNPAAVDRAAVHLVGFGKVCVLFFTSHKYKLLSYLIFLIREDLVSWQSKRKQYALATFATIDGSKRALRASPIKTMYGDMGILEPSPSMWTYLDPTSSGSTRHLLHPAPSSGKEAQGGSESIDTASVLAAMEKRMKEIETLLEDSRKSWRVGLKAIEGDVGHLKELYGGLSDNTGANECCTTAKTASRDTTCQGSRVSPDTNDHLMRLLLILMEELKRRATS